MLVGLEIISSFCSCRRHRPGCQGVGLSKCMLHGARFGHQLKFFCFLFLWIIIDLVGPLLEKYFSLPFLAPIRTLEGLFELTWRPSRALDSPCALLQELKRYNDSVRCAVLGTKIPGHCQEQLIQTSVENALLHTDPWLWKVNRIEFVTRPAWCVVWLPAGRWRSGGIFQLAGSHSWAGGSRRAQCQEAQPCTSIWFWLHLWPSRRYRLKNETF